MREVINLLNEVGMLAKTPRSGFAFLGSGKQSVAEHSYRMALVALALAHIMEESVHIERLLLICLTHDLPEARTGDMNYVNKKYVKVDEAKALNELKEESVLGREFVEYIDEYNGKKSIEAKIAKDADQLELLLCLKEEHDKGNPRAMDWFDNGVKRLITDAAKSMAQEIWSTPSDAWWVRDKNDSHWIHGGTS
ncbi:MAG: HD domain-containing protein [Chlamydiota bacterium]